MKQLLIMAFFLSTHAARADVWTFETPSENIQCVVGEDTVGSDLTCTINSRFEPPAAPRPADCTLSWGHSFFMRDRGPVEMLCVAFDYDLNSTERAEYGVTGTFGGFTCQSTRKGLDCRNLDGHGFFLSRAVQRVY